MNRRTSIMLTAQTMLFSVVFLLACNGKSEANDLIPQAVADTLARRPAMKAYLIPAQVYPGLSGDRDIEFILNEALATLSLSAIKTTHSFVVPSNTALAVISKALIAKDFPAYSGNTLYMMNSNEPEIKDREYIVSTYASSSAIKLGREHPEFHIDDVIPPARQKIIIDLADRLKEHPDIQAHLLAGKMVNADGSRIILTIHNSAARQIYGSENLPPDQGYAELTPAGIEFFNKQLIEGHAEGYRDEVFYQLNWDIGVRKRDEIVLLGNQLKENHEAMVRLLKSMQGN